MLFVPTISLILELHKLGIPVATLPGAWHYRVSAGTGSRVSAATSSRTGTRVSVRTGARVRAWAG